MCWCDQAAVLPLTMTSICNQSAPSDSIRFPSSANRAKSDDSILGAMIAFGAFAIAMLICSLRFGTTLLNLFREFQANAVSHLSAVFGFSRGFFVSKEELIGIFGFIGGLKIPL